MRFLYGPLYHWTLELHVHYILKLYWKISKEVASSDHWVELNFRDKKINLVEHRIHHKFLRIYAVCLQRGIESTHRNWSIGSSVEHPRLCSASLTALWLNLLEKLCYIVLFDLDVSFGLRIRILSPCQIYILPSSIWSGLKFSE